VRRYPFSVRATRGGASPVMIGRDYELHRLMRLVSSSRPRVAIVAGEPRIGKTRVINELVAALPEQTVVIAGDAQPGSLGRPAVRTIARRDREHSGRSTVGAFQAGSPRDRPAQEG